jgi:phosphate-selective porin OprO and OprP
MNIKLHKLVATALASTFILGFGANTMADTTDDIVNALIAKGVLTEEEGALLLNGRQLENATKAKTPAAKFKDGMTFESPDGNFSFTPTGRVHTDYRIFNHNEGKTNTAPAGTTNSIANTTSAGADTFDIRRARIGFKTKYKEFYEAELNADIATGDGGGNGGTSVTRTTWDVAYFNVAWWKQAQFRFGLFKMPMNLEEVTSSNNIDFMERSYVNALAPQKEIGAMIHGVPFAGTTYALAVSNGAGKSADTDIREDGKDVIGRITANFAEMGATPNKEAIYHAGISYSQGDQPQGVVGVNGRTESRGVNPFFRAPTLANTAFTNIDRSRIGVEGAFALRQFKLQGEWLQQNNQFSTPARGYDLDTTAWYAEALWAITGEKYADGYKNGVMGGIKPLKDFDPATFTGGAWEVGVRYNKFDASDYNSIGVGNGTTNDTAFGTTTGASAATNLKAAGFSEAKSYTAGIKFLPNANMRFMLNYVKTNFDNVIGGTTGGIVLNNKRIDDEQAVLMRAQWMF